MATSAKQTIPLTEVYDYYLAPGDPATATTAKGKVGRTVKVTLQYNLALTLSPDPLVWVAQETVYTTLTDANGFWHVFLVPNNKITPANTYYTVEIEGGPSYNIQVTDIGVPGVGWQSSAPGILLNIPAALAPTTSTVGAITATGLITAQAGINITAGGLTIAGGETDVGGLTVDTITYSLAVSRVIPGATSFAVRNNANTQDNLLVTDAGNVTARGSLTVTAGPLTVSAGGAAVTGNSTVTGTLTVSSTLTVSANGATITGNSTVTGTLTVTADVTLSGGSLILSVASSKIVPGATSLSLRNNANSADNLLIPDNGQAVFRNGLALLGGSVNVGAGTLGYAEVTADQGTFTALTDITGLSVTATVGSGRRIRVSCLIAAASSVANDNVGVQIREGATTLQELQFQVNTAGNAVIGVYVHVILTPTAASHTYKISMRRVTGTGNITMKAVGGATPQIASILVEDIGT